MRCYICGGLDAQVRPEEIPTARITGKAHIDCGDRHAQYRPLSTLEKWEIAEGAEKARLEIILRDYGHLRQEGNLGAENGVG